MAAIMLAAPLHADIKRRLDGDGVSIWYHQSQRQMAHHIKEVLPGILRDVGANLDMTVPAQVEVLICANHREMALNLRGEVPSWSAALAQPSRSRILISSDRLTPGDRIGLERVLRHEAAHILFGGLPAPIRTRIPLWFEEGVAQKYAGPLFLFDQGALAARIDVWESLPLGDWERRFPASEEGARTAYLYSEAIVRLMMRLWGSDVVHRILDELGRVESFSEAVYNVTHHPIVWHEKRLHEEIASDRSLYIRTLYGFFGSVCFLGVVPLLLVGVYRVRLRRRERFAQWDEEERLLEELTENRLDSSEDRRLR